MADSANTTTVQYFCAWYARYSTVAQKIHVVFGVNDLAVGGMQRQLVEQLRHFDRTEFSFTLVTLFSFPGKPSLYEALPSDVAVHELNFHGSLDLCSWVRLYNVLKLLNPDIVVSSLFFSNTAFRILKPLVGYVSIAREHNTYVDKSAFHQAVDRLLAPLSHTIIAVSRTVASFTAAQEGIPLERFTVIRNGIDRDSVAALLARLPAREELRAKHNLRDEPILVTVGRLVEQKNHTLLIESFAELLKIMPRAHLRVVGDGPLRGALAKRADELGILPSVTFLGFLERDDVFRELVMADVMISTSRIEGLSNAYLEALAAGVPVVATKTAGTDELIEQGINGYYVTQESPTVVADFAYRALKAGAALRAAALESVERFDIRDTVQRYQELFKATRT